jgi:DNA-binding IclR family transcriptional regulator
VTADSGVPGASVSKRIFALLDTFDELHREQRLSDMARRASLPLATAHRLAANLVGWGGLVRAQDGRYSVGPRLWELGLLAPAREGLREIASPFLHDVYGATLATVHLAVRDGSRVLYLERVRGNASIPVVSTVGTRLPMHATGVGKVLLAYAPQDVQLDVMANLTRVTPYTIVHLGRLRHELTRVRDDGYAQTNEEMSLGAASVAVPVRNASDDVVAALGVVVATLKRERAKFVAALTVAAQGIRRSIAASNDVDAKSWIHPV